MSDTPPKDPHASVSNAVILGEVLGQLKGIQVAIQASRDDTNRRIDDLRISIDGRFQAHDTRLNGHEERIGKLEDKERSTAIRSSASGAATGLLVTGLIEGIKALINMRPHP